MCIKREGKLEKSNVNTKDSIEILLASFSSHDDKHFLRGQNVHRIIDKYFYKRFMLVTEKAARNNSFAE